VAHLERPGAFWFVFAENSIYMARNCRKERHLGYLPAFMRLDSTSVTLSSFTRWNKSDMHCKWRRKSTNARRLPCYFLPQETGSVCGLFSASHFSPSGGNTLSLFLEFTLPTNPFPNSGNGLISYYINIVLEGVGIRGVDAKAAISGGLQVCG
jgi:hypothetical protein